VAYKPFGPLKSMDLGPLALTRSYDQRFQVTGIQAGTVLNYGYTHDGAGNVETISGLPQPDFFPRLTDLTYNANRMATQNTDWIGAGVVLPSPAAVYSYDNAGNIVSDGLHTDYFYNQNNRLVRVEIDGFTVAEYAYDAFERRVLKVVNGVTTHFHYDLNGLLISETDGNGNPRKDYVYLNGEPVAMKVYGGSAGWYWFINDHLGTPQKMVDDAGNVVWAAAYAPFGEARVYEDEVTNNLRFPGQYYDVETGLHYNWHRYYDPETGRYFRADPIGLAGGINPYIYTLNNPVNLIDPMGLDPLDPITGERSEVMGCHHEYRMSEGEIAFLLFLYDIADFPSGEGIGPGLAMVLGKKTLEGVKLTGRAKKKIGNLFKIKDKDAAQAIRERGGNASNVAKALGEKLKGKKVGEIANMAAEGDEAAETALKIIKQAGKKGQKY
jgi:RHS repeat-associated protein